MSRKLLTAAARWSRFLAALGAFVLLARFALKATAWASERRDAAADAEAQERGGERARALERVREALDPDQKSEEGALSEPPRASASASETGARRVSGEAPRVDSARASKRPTQPPKRRTLLVDLGPARSDVFVNGVAVGRTPYAGTWSCRDDDEVGIVVLPQGKMPPIHTTARCGGAIRADSREGTKELDERDLALLLGDESVGVALKEALRRRARP